MNLTKPQTLILVPEGVKPGVKKGLSSITIVIVTQKMQQAARVSNFTTFLMTDQAQSGSIDIIGPTEKILTNPKNQKSIIM